MGQSLIQRTFASGEIAPALAARADLAKYLSGLGTCKNFVVRPEGGVENRSGTSFTQAAKTTLATVRIIPYLSETVGNSILIEMGVGYFRFFRNGGPLKLTGVPAWSGVTTYVPGDIVAVAGVNYYCFLGHVNHTPPNPTYWYAMPSSGQLELPSPYGGNGLPNVSQSGNILTLTNALEVPRELICYSVTRWVLQDITTAPWSSPPGGLAGVAGAVGTLTKKYVVTAAALNTYEETTASNIATVATTLDGTPAAPIALTWTPLAGTAEYYVYCDPYNNGTFGYIGTATGAAAFGDTGFIPDFNVTPPLTRTLFGAPGTYPRYSATYQQRRLFGYTNSRPQIVEGSRVGFRSNFAISSPLQDDDAIEFELAGIGNNPVRGLIGLSAGLIALTDGGEWTVTSGAGPRAPLAPNSLNADQQTYVGIADVPPLAVGNGIVYVQARGRVIRELMFDFQVQGLAGRDLTLYAPHLFRDFTITRLAFQQVPSSIVWAVRSDGALLGLTYLPEQDVWGWHRHETWQNAEQGVIEDACVVPETDYDALYLVVKRTVGGAVVRYIERLEDRTIRAGHFDEDVYFVDAGLSYSGAPVSTVSGLSHLEGQTVAVVADGSVLYDGNPTGAAGPSWRVTGGAIALGGSYSNVHVGLAIRYPDLELLDVDVQGSSVRDKKKLAKSITLLVERSSRAWYAGPDTAHLRQHGPATFDVAADEFTGQCELILTAAYEKTGRVFIRQTAPLPLTILGAIPSVQIGG